MEPLSPTRRRVLQMLALTGASAGFNLQEGLAQDDTPLADLPIAQPLDTLTDPNMLDPKYHLGWQKPLTPAEMQTTSSLCDTIIPADDKSPSASQAKVPDFIQEWAGAPYEENQRDLEIVRITLKLLDAESIKRFGRPFKDASETDKTQLCDAICNVDTAAAEMKDLARGFDRFRYLTIGGFYTTPEGRADLGYIGNVPSGAYAGASEEAKKHLGV